MRIAYLLSVAVPSREADTQQALKTVDALGAAGAEVDLVLPASRRTRRLGTAGFEAELRAYYSLRSPFRLVTVRTLEPRERLEAQRPLHALVACLGLARGRYDVVYTRSRSAPFLCALRGQPVVFETYRRLGQGSPRLAALLAVLARRPELLGVVTHSNLARRSLEGVGFPGDKLATIHNGHDPEDLLPRLERAEARARLGLDPLRPLCCYAGNVGQRKGLSAILDLAALTREVDYLLVGGREGERAALDAEVARRGLPNVRSADWRPAPRVAPFLYAADVLVIPPTADPLDKHGRTVLPLKTFLYMGAGRPILGPDLPDLREVLAHGESAWLVPPDDPPAAAAAIRALLAEAGLAESLGRAARLRAGGLTWRARAERILAQIEEWRARPRAGRGDVTATAGGAG